MHEPIVFIGVLILLAILAGGLTLCILKRLSSTPEDAGDEARNEAESLREHAEAMNRSSADIEKRAKRLEFLLMLQGRSRDE